MDDGREIFGLMNGVLFVEPDIDHYSGMIDLLGWPGCLEEAIDLIEYIPPKCLLPVVHCLELIHKAYEIDERMGKHVIQQQSHPSAR